MKMELRAQTRSTDTTETEILLLLFIDVCEAICAGSKNWQEWNTVLPEVYHDQGVDRDGEHEIFMAGFKHLQYLERWTWP